MNRSATHPGARARARVALFGAAAGLACADVPASAPAALAVAIGRLQQPIIGGLPAASPELDHTGALVYRVRSSGSGGALCTATLIGPQTLVTAKHCVSVLPVFERIGIDVFWARGPDFTQPAELNAVVAAAADPDPAPGLSGYGRDVAVAHLDRAVTDIEPVLVRPFTPELVGMSLVTLGYGVSSAGGQVDGLRRIGRETVARVSGNAYEALFGDFESFVEYQATRAITELDILPLVAADPALGDLAALQLEYDAAELLPGGEIITGKVPGDTQSCELDSGGPLARFTPEGVWETYAVVSSGLRFERPICDHGQVFASFGPGTFELLDAERSWQDPCGDVGAQGECRGGVLHRCETSFALGVRRLVEEACE